MQSRGAQNKFFHSFINPPYTYISLRYWQICLALVSSLNCSRRWLNTVSRIEKHIPDEKITKLSLTSNQVNFNINMS